MSSDPTPAPAPDPDPNPAAIPNPAADIPFLLCGCCACINAATVNLVASDTSTCGDNPPPPPPPPVPPPANRRGESDFSDSVAHRMAMLFTRNRTLVPLPPPGEDRLVLVMPPDGSEERGW